MKCICWLLHKCVFLFASPIFYKKTWSVQPSDIRLHKNCLGGIMTSMSQELMLTTSQIWWDIEAVSWIWIWSSSLHLKALVNVSIKIFSCPQKVLLNHLPLLVDQFSVAHHVTPNNGNVYHLMLGNTFGTCALLCDSTSITHYCHNPVSH